MKTTEKVKREARKLENRVVSLMQDIVVELNLIADEDPDAVALKNALDDLDECVGYLNDVAEDWLNHLDKRTTPRQGGKN